jgi:glutamate 5-kinase
VDDGARNALVTTGSSLLAVGVTGSDGGFEPGDAVEIFDAAGLLVGKGLSRAAADEISGFSGPLVHRDDLVVLA